MKNSSKKIALHDFAENEVRIALNRLDKDNTPYHLIESCYCNALRAYDLLLNDETLDLTMDFTRQILMRIIQKKAPFAYYRIPRYVDEMAAIR